MLSNREERRGVFTTVVRFEYYQGILKIHILHADFEIGNDN